MTHPIDDLHVYLRTIQADERTSLSVLASHIHSQASVLDLGCGSGALGQYLSETRSCVSDGLTWSQREADHARPFYRKVVVADLEQCDLNTVFGSSRYDYIVCADVLEHLRQPERILDACRSLLKPSGQLLISVPNAGYCGLIAELLQGEFRYREEGLLDKTHLRFFTRRSLTRFMDEHQWKMQTLETVERELPESEFKSRFDNLPPAVARYLLATPDALTYQFIGAAIPEAVSDKAELEEPPLASAQAGFTAQLYLGYDGSYSEDKKLSTLGSIGVDQQSLHFHLPKDKKNLSALRLDPSDRPGFLHLYRIAVQDGEGHPLWEWKYGDKGQPIGAKHQQVVWNAPLYPASSAAILLLTGDDPWFELPIPSNVLSKIPELEDAVVVIEVGWPMSADYLALANTVQPLQLEIEKLSQLTTSKDQEISQFQQSLNQTQSQLNQTQSQLNQTQSQLNQTQSQLEQTQSQLTQTQSQLHEKGLQLSQLQAQLQQADAQILRASTQLAHAHHTNTELANHRQELMAHRQELMQACKRQQTEFDALAAYLRSIENSTVFRATRPLVKAKMWLDQMLGRRVAPSTPLQGPQPLVPAPHSVDVIVPVYRGLADTQLCIGSALASQCKTPFRLVVINDASPEPEVTQWLREQAAQEPRILLLENEVNLGFVGTVNRGMALSESNDVLLLNSDTEVANDWLDRIRNAAYSDTKVGSVTPFSNNATICSYPQFCKDNELPAGYDTARLDKLCAQTNPGMVVDVPTGVGFCMYIRRDCLQEVGLFDTANFGKGYGEENDFCQRAQAAGWRNLHLLDTFVLHTGGVSFGASKSPREQAAMETLRRLHPRYEPQVMAFVQADPARVARLALDIARIKASGKPVVLAVVHDRSGGTVRHIHELAQHLNEQVTTLLLSPVPGHRVKLSLPQKQEAFALEFEIPAQMDDLQSILRSLGVRHIHYHHLLGHHPSIKQLPAQLGVRYDFTAHDFYSYCARISLTDNSDRYVPEPGPGQCGCCAAQSHAPDGSTMQQWRDSNRVFLEAARHVFAPSQDTARRMAAFAPAANVIAVPHTDMQTQSPAPQVHPMADTARLKVAVIGALSTIKGADVLESVALQAAHTDAPLDFHLLGYGYRSLQTQPKARLTVHGAYAEADLPELLAWLQPDIVWFPALWPETYSYTLSAALQASLPIVAPDIGAFAERLEGRAWSWVEPWDQTPAEWLTFFTRIRQAHFVPQQPPTPPQPAKAHKPSLGEPAVAAAWAYATGYLAGMAPAPLAPAQVSLAFLQAHQPTSTPAQETRSKALQALVWLRSLPLLRGVARCIPRHWQTRVKNWLRA